MADTVSYTLNVNGVNYPVTAPSGMPLLWVLRDILGFTGTKYSCGIEKCFACTVMVNGQAEHSCVFDATSAIGNAVAALTGVGKRDLPFLLQAAPTSYITTGPRGGGPRA